MYCRKCGTPNPDDRSSCLQCNAPLTSSLPQKPSSGPVSSGPMQTQTTPTSSFTDQPSAPTTIIPSQQSTGRPTPTTGPITNPTPPSYQQQPPSYQQQPPSYQQQSQPFQQQQPSYQQQQQQPSYQQSMQQSHAQMSYGAPPPQVRGQATNTLAILSLISGIIGLFACLCGLLTVPAVAGLVMGFIALKKVQETGEKGREMAIAGMVTGGLGLLLFIGWVIFYVILRMGGGSHF